MRASARSCRRGACTGRRRDCGRRASGAGRRGRSGSARGQRVGCGTPEHLGGRLAHRRRTPGGRCPVPPGATQHPGLDDEAGDLGRGSARTGPDHRYETILYGGPTTRRNGRALTGPLYLRRGGDPVLSTPAYSAAHLDGIGGHLPRLARHLSGIRIRSVRGPIVADGTVFDRRRTGPKWRARTTGSSPPRCRGSPPTRATPATGSPANRWRPSARRAPERERRSGRRVSATAVGSSWVAPPKARGICLTRRWDGHPLPRFAESSGS